MEYLQITRQFRTVDSPCESKEHEEESVAEIFTFDCHGEGRLGPTTKPLCCDSRFISWSQSCLIGWWMMCRFLLETRL